MSAFRMRLVQTMKVLLNSEENLDAESLTVNVVASWALKYRVYVIKPRIMILILEGQLRDRSKSFEITSVRLPLSYVLRLFK